ncbi:hypothetical protein LINPERHAP2_LOCUS16023, partial [Linum perenne]
MVMGQCGSIYPQSYLEPPLKLPKLFTGILKILTNGWDHLELDE